MQSLDWPTTSTGVAYDTLSYMYVRRLQDPLEAHTYFLSRVHHWKACMHVHV